NLLLARASSRGQELAIRGALGAPRRTLVAQMLSESLALTLVGAGLGLLAAWWGIDALWDIMSSQRFSIAPFMRFELSGPVIAVAAVAALLSAIVSGLPPALRASRVDVNEMLKENVRTSTN